MKYPFERIMQAIVCYADAEVMSQLPQSGKWVVGTALTIATLKYQTLFESIRNNQLFTMLGIVDSDGMVDADLLLNALKDSSNKYGKITISFPVVGDLSFNGSDIDRIKAYLQ